MLLYVTSFAQDMYHATGKHLIDSYLNTKQIGKLLICNEGFDIDLEHPQLLFYRLDKSQLLSQWLTNNQQFIPEYLGGTAKEEKMPLVYTAPNRKTSRWFRKIVALYYAYQTYGLEYSTIVWIDSDCLFKKQITMDKYITIFKKNVGVFYYLGKKRLHDGKGVESGFIGFHRDYNGYNLIRFVMEELYQKQNYLKYIRWDDGYMFRIALSLNTSINTIDLAINSRLIDVINDNNNYFTDYIIHNKGFHRINNILV